MYRQSVDHPEKAVYWKLTIEFGRIYEKMQREWCDYCIRELERVRDIKYHGKEKGTVIAEAQEE